MNEAEEAEPLQPPPPPPAPEDDFMEYADTQEPMSPSAAAAAAVPQTEAEIMLVNLPQPSPSAAGQLYHTKLPSFLRIESQPFDPATFDPDAEEQLGPVSVESVLRWRWQQQQQQSAAPQKQSNSRIVTWSDGSKSLQVGQELFDVVLQPASTTGATYLVAAHDYATLAETQARISGHMTFVPSAVGSSTHAKLATGVSQRHVKTERTQTIQVHVDPMAQLAAEQAKEQARLRQQRKSRRKSQRARSDSGGSSADEGNLGGYRRGAGPRYAYESDDEDEAGFVVDDEEDAPDDGGADDLDRADRAGAHTTPTSCRLLAGALS